MKIAVITGSAGLIGSQACEFFHSKGFYIIGIDNDMRAHFFGKDASTKLSRISLESNLENYQHNDVDIRDYKKIELIFRKYKSKIQIVVHAAAQPSHDWAALDPIMDFTVNANGTLNMLEATRLNCPDATFVFTSTNKVYGDRPNISAYTNSPDLNYRNMQIREEKTRWEAYFVKENLLAEIDESMSIDDSKHSLFGASKISADVLCQEYGKYFGMNVGVFRGGCLTGPNHAGTELHGFLSYLVKCIINDKPYTIHGYKGKQVRDNIHSYDLVNMFWHFHNKPRPGQVYNAGGGRSNSTSILEAIETVNKIAGKKWSNYTIASENRIGDHIWYISDISKFKSHYPAWDIKIGLKETLEQMIAFEIKKGA